MGSRVVVLGFACVLLPIVAQAQQNTCRFFCGVEFKVEPTITIENLARRHRIASSDGTVERVTRERVFETVLAVDLETRIPRFGVTVEAIFSPFADDSAVELEFEANFDLITESLTGGWVTSHFDVVDKFSPAERPADDRAYTHKLDLELDTAFHVFNFLPEDRWLHGVELEISLDFLATGLPRKGDVFPDGSRYLDDASRWSLSFVFVLPVAPF